MTEIINHGSNNHQRTANEYQTTEQDNSANVQVDQISKFLLECPEAALNVHKYLQKKYLNIQERPSEPLNSTPKRSRPLDDSAGSTNNGSGQRKYPRKGFQDDQQLHLRSSPLMSNEHQPQLRKEDTTKQKRVPIEQLKHAVSSNLPCFLIEFDSDVDRNRIPSAIQASDIIFKEVQSNGVLINKFSLVGWNGKKLKLGVNNKADYATLVSTDKWPTKINGIDIVVIKPKYVPDSFALVIRYVPRDLEENFVESEIKRTIASAEQVKRIHYSYNRKNDDYRFNVKDYNEYNTALQLGRIAIGHSWLSITKFYPGVRLTYCTKCWSIGHLRNKCSSTSKCRVCLENININDPHNCKKEPKCAQCDGKHHSLDSQCLVIQDYKMRLKEDVDDAINKGIIHRLEPKEKNTVFEPKEQDFPVLVTGNKTSNFNWGMNQPRSTSEANLTSTSDTAKAISSINDKLVSIIESNQRIEEKSILQIKVLNTVALDTQLHQAVLMDTISTMLDFMKDFIPSLLTSGKVERLTLIPHAQIICNRFYNTLTRLNDGFQRNHQPLLTQSSIGRGAERVTTTDSSSTAQNLLNSYRTKNVK